MKRILLQLAAYRKWANRQIIDTLKTVPEEVLSRDMNDSFGGIRNTLFHLLLSEHIWWDRIRLQENISPPSDSLKKDFAKMTREILKFSDAWMELIEEASENRLQHVFEYRNSKKEAFKQPLYEVLLHILNHQTYHYGQIITMLREQGIDKLPATDFIKFSRSVKRP
ncbi:MAG TPA: DinB family protein [Ginsengibacter sp.]|nr:DinB family protein [Ginsengibacter sp.]HRP17778.1 DinB family protein [Ginsengibacter sp.]